MKVLILDHVFKVFRLFVTGRCPPQIIIWDYWFLLALYLSVAAACLKCACFRRISILFRQSAQGGLAVEQFQSLSR